MTRIVAIMTAFAALTGLAGAAQANPIPIGTAIQLNIAVGANDGSGENASVNTFAGFGVPALPPPLTPLSATDHVVANGGGSSVQASEGWASSFTDAGHGSVVYTLAFSATNQTTGGTVFASTSTNNPPSITTPNGFAYKFLADVTGNILIHEASIASGTGFGANLKGLTSAVISLNGVFVNVPKVFNGSADFVVPVVAGDTDILGIGNGSTVTGNAGTGTELLADALTITFPEPDPVPEPPSLAFFGAALAVLMLIRRRKSS